MFVIYVVFSIAGWVALGLFLSYWAGMVFGKRIARRENIESTDTHENPS